RQQGVRHRRGHRRQLQQTGQRDRRVETGVRRVGEHVPRDGQHVDRHEDVHEHPQHPHPRQRQRREQGRAQRTDGAATRGAPAAHGASHRAISTSSGSPCAAPSCSCVTRWHSTRARNGAWPGCRRSYSAASGASSCGSASIAGRLFSTSARSMPTERCPKGISTRSPPPRIPCRQVLTTSPSGSVPVENWSSTPKGNRSLERVSPPTLSTATHPSTASTRQTIEAVGSEDEEGTRGAYRDPPAAGARRPVRRARGREGAVPEARAADSAVGRLVLSNSVDVIPEIDGFGKSFLKYWR